MNESSWNLPPFHPTRFWLNNNRKKTEKTQHSCLLPTHTTDALREEKKRDPPKASSIVFFVIDLLHSLSYYSIGCFRKSSRLLSYTRDHCCSLLAIVVILDGKKKEKRDWHGGGAAGRRSIRIPCGGGCGSRLCRYSILLYHLL